MPIRRQPHPSGAEAQDAGELRDGGEILRLLRTHPASLIGADRGRGPAKSSAREEKHAAAEGIGVACLSQWAVGDMIAAGRLQRLPTTLPVMRRQCYLVVHRDKQPTPALLRFTEKARRMTQAAGLTTSLPLAHSEAESSGHAGKRQGKFFNTME